MSGQSLKARRMQFVPGFRDWSGEGNRRHGRACALPLRLHLAEHRLHLIEGMAITAACGTRDAGPKPFDRLRFFARARQRLRGHEVACSVIRIVGQELIEFCNGKAGFAAAGQFHGDPVSSEAVSWVKRENLFQSGDFIHLACDRADFGASDRGGFAVLARIAQTGT